MMSSLEGDKTKETIADERLHILVMKEIISWSEKNEEDCAKKGSEKKKKKKN